ncbi:MAG: ribonuclease HI [Anaerolineae bacterium]|nr:ribonuclease HI [Anaerolineae bacterium]
MSKPKVTIYTDGSCNPNPGPGGWAAVLLHPRQPPHELSGAEAETTNNRMELRAALEALRALKRPHCVQLYTDSQYLRQGIVDWPPRWEKGDWQTTGQTAIKNQDLWQALVEQVRRHEITWHWTRGHAGDRWNEHVDRLARAMIPAAALPLDDERVVHVFAAASYLGREKKGGWAVLLRCRDQIKTLSGGETDTSINRLHIRSALEGLRALPRAVPVHLYTTSDYLKNGATAWMRSWAADGWRTRDGGPVKHRELWETLADLSGHYEIAWHVVDAHNAPDEMAQVKKLAGEAARAASGEG